MNIAKNMEAIFVTVVAIVSATSFATAAVPAHLSRVAAAHAAVKAEPLPMQVVIVSAKRLSAAEKAAMDI
jgi:hypothetical protein